MLNLVHVGVWLRKVRLGRCWTSYVGLDYAMITRSQWRLVDNIGGGAASENCFNIV